MKKRIQDIKYSPQATLKNVFAFPPQKLTFKSYSKSLLLDRKYIFELALTNLLKKKDDTCSDFKK